MILDERITTVRNRYAAGAYLIVYIFLLVDLLLRIFYFHQVPGEYWDIFLIWFASSLYVGIRLHSSGAVPGESNRKQFKVIIPSVIISLLVSSYAMGGLRSINDLGETVLGLVVAFPVIISVYFFFSYLNRRWEKKNKIEE